MTSRSSCENISKSPTSLGVTKPDLTISRSVASSTLDSASSSARFIDVVSSFFGLPLRFAVAAPTDLAAG